MMRSVKRIESISDACKWVWAFIMRRGGKASAASLRAQWYWDPALLDDALTRLRDGGMLRCVRGTWYVPDGEWTGTARLKPGSWGG